MPAISFTITDTTKNFRISDIINGLAGAGGTSPAGATYPNARSACKMLSIQAVTPGTNVLLGDSKLSATNMGQKIPGGGSFTFPTANSNSIGLSDKYVRADVNPTTLNIMWEYF